MNLNVKDKLSKSMTRSSINFNVDTTVESKMKVLKGYSSIKK